VTDGQTDGQTDRVAMANTRYEQYLLLREKREDGNKISPLLQNPAWSVNSQQSITAVFFVWISLTIQVTCAVDIDVAVTCASWLSCGGGCQRPVDWGAGRWQC